eukprot:TRINITY_DN76_c1_g1_i3.p1 TRINITY_DN76_c1_g1~~TRINITY_DN76_c1_g1_i3.p1  ORF type:complete len:314 (-),score=90.72 TRINITY_DN76_c1_g1_i3:136-1077(-)
MLEMGFRPDVVRIMAFCPPIENRQTLLFSATIPNELLSIVPIALKKNHVYLDCVGEEEPTHMHVQQSVIVSELESHFVVLLDLILKEKAKNPSNHKVLVFYTTARLAQFYAELFNCIKDEKVPVLEIHSRKSQSQRQRVSEQFRAGKALVLFSSDVSARGMDYPGVTLVLQMGVPSDRQTYVHRLGRTARAGDGGAGTLVLTRDETYFLREVKDIPIERKAFETSPQTLQHLQRTIHNGLQRVDEQTKVRAYIAWMGFYNSNLRKMKWSKPDLVRRANEYALNSLLLASIPPIRYKTVCNMGLKGTPGLVLER